MRLAFFVVAVLVALPVWAQTSQPDNATILKAIQGLSGRIESLQRDVDQLKGRPAAPATRAAQQKAPAPSASPLASAPTGKALKGGWLVNVVLGDERDQEAIAKFAGPLSAFNFGMHTKYVSGGNEYAYEGEGFFHAAEAGRYVFVLDLRPVSTNCCDIFNCDGKLSVQDTPVVSGETSYGNIGPGPFDAKNREAFRSQVFSGSMNLDQPGDYPIRFTVGCWYNRDRKGEVLDRGLATWEHNSFKVLVRGPDDSVARPFEDNELFHKVGRKTP